MFALVNLMKRVRSLSAAPACALGSDAPAVAIVFLKRKDLRADSFHRTEFMCGVDLLFDSTLLYAVYVLRCAQPGQLSAPAYYVGFALLKEVLDRLGKHFDHHDESPAFTKQNKPQGVEFLWPVRNRSAEGYVFSFLLEKFNKEDDVLRHVLVGGWTQTSAKPLGASDCNRLQREHRMVKDRCLECGMAGHFARRCPKLLAKASAAKPSSGAAVAAPMAKAARLSLPVVKASPSVRTPSQAKAAPPAVAVDWEQRAETWLDRKQELAFDNGGWTAFKAVLISLELPWKNPNRYLEAETDVCGKLWKLGRKQPKDGSDFKRGNSKHGGKGPFLIRRAFLKSVLVERYRHKL